MNEPMISSSLFQTNVLEIITTPKDLMRMRNLSAAVTDLHTYEARDLISKMGIRWRFDTGPFDHFVTPKNGCSIAEGFHLLYFSLDEFYVLIRVFTLT